MFGVSGGLRGLNGLGRVRDLSHRLCVDRGSADGSDRFNLSNYRNHKLPREGVGGFHRPPRSFSFTLRTYLRSCSAICVDELACAKIAVPACTRIWFRVNTDVSRAKSASLIRDSAAVWFSAAVCRAWTVRSSRVCKAPTLARD